MNKDNPKPTDDYTGKRVDGPTPAGGAYSEIYFFGEIGLVDDPESATHGSIVEYKEDGTRIMETFFLIKK